ncbi:MAG: hypothetical protein IJE09_01485 [Oscillospiraceae bacterium]|nr:hypothetical protein [Oscillospiraceae bacterium]
MDILKMTVGECMKDARIKAIVEKHIPEIGKFPVMLFAKKSCGELIKMGLKQGLFTQNDADMMVERINKELEKLG